MTMAKILVADDEQSICDAFSAFLTHEGHTALTASTGAEAITRVSEQKPDAMFLDVRMPGNENLEALREIKKLHPDLPVIVMTAHGTLDTALEAMRLQAFDYIGKPVELSRARELLRRALHLNQPDAAPGTIIELPDGDGLPRLVGQSPAMQEVFKMMGLLCANDLSVLITGESGVGKELVAHGIHDNSQRADQPFIAVNCAAIPDGLIETELFGHEKGAFTSAHEMRVGRFEAAGNGTLFLDEVSELPLHLQSKLLRVLQERNFERVGSSATHPFRARLIAASNRDLEDETRAGRFREDLYHRLNLATLTIPPLRERKSDVAILAGHFLQVANEEVGKRISGIDREALERLEAYAWRGNVRELEHTIKRAALVARGTAISVHDIDIDFADTDSGSGVATSDELRSVVRAWADRAFASFIGDGPGHDDNARYQEILRCVEEEVVAAALARTGGNQVAASKFLGLSRTTLRSKIRTGEE
jgi:DNA-binding NtrC family response regulator